jgi:uncharacterized protein (DUF433 family)
MNVPALPGAVQGASQLDKEDILRRIAVNPRVMLGKPVVRGTRLTVQFILGLLAAGATVDDILAEYGGLTREDVQACLLFATEALESSSFLALTVETP